MDFQLPAGFDAVAWIERWDRMQERYNPRREEWYSTIIEVIRCARPKPRRFIDLGCGTGSLARRLLEAFDEAEVLGVDLDPSMLALAREQLRPFGDRVRLVESDLRLSDWAAHSGGRADAVVSATTLHWLMPQKLVDLYGQVAKALRRGGIFVNADHATSISVDVQRMWDDQRQKAFDRPEARGVDDWAGFWKAFGEAVGFDVVSFRAKILSEKEGIEEGLPLTWHFDQLRAAGFTRLDCFWRYLGDAVFGGLHD